MANADMIKPPEDRPDFETWPPKDAVSKPLREMPDWPKTIWRGMCGRCPQCGAAPIFDGYLKVHERCLNCAAPLGDMPADDAPPYIAMLAVLHFLALFIVIFYKGIYVPGWVTVVLALLLLAVLCMIALRMAKGAVIGVLLKLGLNREKVVNG